MKKILLVSGIALFSSATMFAQQQAVSAQQKHVEASRVQRKQFTPEEMAKVKTARLDKIVSLQEAQKEKVYAIYLKEAEAAKGRAGRNDKVRTEIKSLLDESQNARLTAYQQERMDKVRQRLMRSQRDTSLRMRSAAPVK